MVELRLMHIIMLHQYFSHAVVLLQDGAFALLATAYCLLGADLDEGKQRIVFIFTMVLVPKS